MENSVKSRPPPSELKEAPPLGNSGAESKVHTSKRDGDATDINTVIRESSSLQICHEQRILLLLASYLGAGGR
jgi:hypothetical protein